MRPEIGRPINLDLYRPRWIRMHPKWLYADPLDGYSCGPCEKMLYYELGTLAADDALFTDPDYAAKMDDFERWHWMFLAASLLANGKPVPAFLRPLVEPVALACRMYAGEQGLLSAATLAGLRN